MSSRNTPKQLKKLKRCLEGLHRLGITCSQPVTNIWSHYNFKCQLCGHLLKGKVGTVNGAGCPNIREHSTNREDIRMPLFTKESNDYEDKNSDYEDKNSDYEDKNSDYYDILSILITLENNNIFCLSQTHDKWWCSVCKHTWNERFRSLADRLYNPLGPCSNCVKTSNENSNYLKAVKDGDIKRVAGDSIDTINRWQCLKCDHIWENNFRNTIHPFKGCTNCIRIKLEKKWPDKPVINDELKPNDSDANNARVEV